MERDGRNNKFTARDRLSVRYFNATSDQIIFIGVIIFPVLWFARAIENLKALGIVGLNFPTLQAKSFLLLPIHLLYEPARLMKAVGRASEPNIHVTDISWKKIAIPAGFGLWWVFFLVSRMDDGVWCLQGTCSSIGDLPVVGLIITTVADISTILLLRRISSRIKKKRHIIEYPVYWNPVQKIRMQHPATWDRKVKDNLVIIYPQQGWHSNAYFLEIQVSSKEEKDFDVNKYIEQHISQTKERFRDFKILRMDPNAPLAGSRAFKL
jgi:Domain of unknown function (DUF4328)